MDEEENDLSDRQLAQYASLELIVENYGMYTQDSTSDGSHYMSGDNNPFLEEGIACYNCVFFEENNACEIVSGVIEPEGLCKLWIIPDILLDGELHKAAYTPPEGVRNAAKQALRWIADGKAGDGFTATGRYRAETLAAGRSVSLDTIKRMNSFFARHEVDKKGKGWDSGSDDYPSAGRVAWAAWGGDAGWSWARGILSDMQKAKSFGGDRSAAAQYAARMRWGQRTHGERNIDTTRVDSLGQTDWGSISPSTKPDVAVGADIALEAGRHASVTPDQIPALTERLIAGDGKENIRLLEVVGTPYFDDHGVTMERSAMPQVPTKRKQEFLAAVEEQGLTVDRRRISPRELKPIQSEINGKSSAEIRQREATRGADAFKAGDDLSIIVSSDGYIMDGHHRWAAAALHDLHGNDVKLSVIQIGAPRDALMNVMQTWTDKAGVKRLGFGDHRTPVGKALAFRKACEIGLQAQKEFLGVAS